MWDAAKYLSMYSQVADSVLTVMGSHTFCRVLQPLSQYNTLSHQLVPLHIFLLLASGFPFTVFWVWGIFPSKDYMWPLGSGLAHVAYCF